MFELIKPPSFNKDFQQSTVPIPGIYNFIINTKYIQIPWYGSMFILPYYLPNIRNKDTYKGRFADELLLWCRCSGIWNRRGLHTAEEDLGKLVKTTRTHWDNSDSYIAGISPCSLVLLMAEILHQLIGSLSHYFYGFIHPRWCRISAINSIIKVHTNLQSRSYLPAC